MPATCFLAPTYCSRCCCASSQRRPVQSLAACAKRGTPHCTPTSTRPHSPPHLNPHSPPLINPACVGHWRQTCRMRSCLRIRATCRRYATSWRRSSSSLTRHSISWPCRRAARFTCRCAPWWAQRARPHGAACTAAWCHMARHGQQLWRGLLAVCAAPTMRHALPRSGLLLAGVTVPFVRAGRARDGCVRRRGPALD